MQVTLEVTDGPGKGRSFDLTVAGAYLVGRSPRCNFAVGPDTKCSRVHFVVDFSPPVCRIRDLGSKHGMIVNGQTTYEAELADGDRIFIGETTLLAHIEQPVVVEPEPEEEPIIEKPVPETPIEPAQEEAAKIEETPPEPAPVELEEPEDSPKKPRARRKKKPAADEDSPKEEAKSDEIVVFLDPPEGTDG